MASRNGVTSGDPYAKDLDIDALIVGAGFGGCYLLHLMRKQGINVKLYEAGKGLGGVWHWNRYPGARVDCELPYYGYSDPAIWSTWRWSERFADYKALRNYFEHVDKIWDLSKDIAFESKVVEASFQDDGRWLVKTADGRQCRCTYFLACTGTSFKQHIPDWKGIDSFKGQLHHSSLWPEEGVDLTDKRVAIIGAGATGVQVMQEAAKVASHVTQFIRTPNLAVPMRQRKITEDEIWSQKHINPYIFKTCRTTATALPMAGTGRKMKEDTPEQQEAVFEEQWKRGGFNFSVGCYADETLDKTANRIKYDFWAKKTRARMTDPKKRDLLAPLEPPYYIGTKRPSLEQDYYEMCDLPHVAIENSPIQEIQEKGILTEDKLHEFDIIAVCTGYDAVTGGLRTMGIKGKDGTDLHEYWKDGVATELGMMVHGYPNMFIVYGPQAPTSFTNGPPFIEMQCEWIADAIAKLREENLATMEAKREAEQKWTKTVHDIANHTLVINTNSWYMGANIPGKRREFLLYLGGVPNWHNACKEALNGWKDFDVKAAV